MNKAAIFSLYLLLSVSVHAQVTLANAKPKPGDRVVFSYTPPASVFADTDKIACVAYMWGTYFEKNDWILNFGLRGKPVEVILKKDGNQYVGAVQTDSMTRMISFTFTSGVVKWRSVPLKSELISGKIDKHGNEGYSFPFYQADGSACQYSNYLAGNYVSYSYMNQLDIKNPRMGAQYFLKELDLFPSAKYYALESLLFAYQEYDKELMKSVAAKQTEKLYGDSLKSWEDLNLMANISAILGGWNQYDYFKGKAREKAKECKGPLPTLTKLVEDFKEEKDNNRKQALLEKAYYQYSLFSVDERFQYNFSESFHHEQRDYIYALAVDPNKTDVLKKYLEETNFYKATIPEEDDTFFFGILIDTLLSKKESVKFTESLLLDLHSFYSGAINSLLTGKPSPTTFVGECYYTLQDKANALATMAALVSHNLVRLYAKKGEDETVWKYAMEMKRYIQVITREPRAMNEWVNLYCTLSEKFLPADECKADVEKFISTGVWKTDMVEILKRLWVKKNQSEAGFDAYFKTLKKRLAEDTKKAAMAKQVNYPAPQFSLKDLDGNEVSLQALSGKIVILDFWATWCGPCKASFPAMQILVNQYKSNPDVKFLFIDTWQKEKTDEEKHKVVSVYIKNKAYTFQVLLDNEFKVVKDYKITGIPTKIVIDKKGNIRYNLIGAQTNEGLLLDEMEAMIESLQ